MPPGLLQSDEWFVESSSSSRDVASDPVFVPGDNTVSVGLSNDERPPPCVPVVDVPIVEATPTPDVICVCVVSDVDVEGGSI